MREYKWPDPIQREDGTACESAEQYFDGPFFDENGISFFLECITGLRANKS